MYVCLSINQPNVLMLTCKQNVFFSYTHANWVFFLAMSVLLLSCSVWEVRQQCCHLKPQSQDCDYCFEGRNEDYTLQDPLVARTKERACMWCKHQRVRACF